MEIVTKLTNEYASNLNCLFFNADKKLMSYFNMFDSIFKSCLLSNNISIAYDDTIMVDVDIVFIKIDNDSKFENHDEIKQFTESLRRDKELLPIYLIKSDVTNPKIVDMIHGCYCLDGLVPEPFNEEKIYRFLYRILKRLMVDKDLYAYIEDLENQLFGCVEIEDVKVSKTTRKNTESLSKDREKDIRFSQTDKISASEFMSLLDDSIIDKVENIEMELENLIGILDKLERVDATTSVSMVQNDIRPIIEDIFILVELMGYFGVTARAFGTLNNFLSTLSVDEFQNEANKSMFITMLLAIINDLEKWLEVIFVEQSTEDIHYLDASFSSNILEIEKVFVEEDEDEGDLEFF